MSDLMAMDAISKKGGDIKAFPVGSNIKRCQTGADGWGEITIAVDNRTILQIGDYVGALYLVNREEFEKEKPL